MEPVFVILGVVALILIARLCAGSADFDRVRDHIQRMGGHLISMRWLPFGPGAFGDKRNRIYELQYRDHEGALRAAHCKTSLFSGVYFSNDRIIESPKPRVGPAPTEDELLAENKRLRDEIERLRSSGS